MNRPTSIALHTFSDTATVTASLLFALAVAAAAAAAVGRFYFADGLLLLANGKKYIGVSLLYLQ